MKLLYIRHNTNRLSYYNEPLRALKKLHEVHEYGPKHYRPEHSIDDVLAVCPWKPDLIVFGVEWLTTEPPQSLVNVAGLQIPAVAFLNKEYGGMKSKKLPWIRENRLAMFFTFVKPLPEWEKVAGTRAMYLPFGVNPDVFKDYGEESTYDLGFSGGHMDGNDAHDPKRTRQKMIALAKSMPDVKLYLKEGYKQLSEHEYARQVSRSKIWLSTTGPIHYVGTRYFEVMASKTLLMCSNIPPVEGWEDFVKAYDGLFEEGKHCIMFDWTLADFQEKVRYYLKHDEERVEIAERARKHVLNHHTWDHRARAFTEAVTRAI